MFRSILTIYLAVTLTACTGGAKPASAEKRAPAQASGHRFTLFSASASAPSPEDQINALFQAHLGRPADAAGLSYYVEQLDSGSSLYQIELTIKNSNEARIRAIYFQYLNREPDASGLSYWLKEVNSGHLTVAQFEASVKNSNEAQIRQFYLTTVDREPDKPGLDYHLAQVNAGRATLASVEAGLKNSREGIEVAIRKFYRKYLNREADDAGLQYYVSEVLAGQQTLAQVEAGLRGSAEGVDSTIRQMYLDHLLRAADTPGFNYWKGEYLNGASLDFIRKNLRASTDCKVDCIRNWFNVPVGLGCIATSDPAVLDSVFESGGIAYMCPGITLNANSNTSPPTCVKSSRKFCF